MAQRSKVIQAEFVEFDCSECGKGVYRVTTLENVIHTQPKQWEHACTNCGRKCHIAKPFPLLRYKGQEFMLAKYAADGIEVYSPVRATLDKSK